MALFDKLNRMAKNIGDKAGDAVEITKLTSDIALENNALNGDLKKIGEFYYNIFAAGGEVAPEVVEFCNSAKVRYDNIAVKQAEIEKIKEENEAEKQPAPAAAPQPIATAVKCPGCGADNTPGTKFCHNCGMKLEVAPPAPRPVEEKTCAGCGRVLPRGTKFCPECGMKAE